MNGACIVFAGLVDDFLGEHRPVVVVFEKGSVLAHLGLRRVRFIHTFSDIPSLSDAFDYPGSDAGI
jgi:hypothetical protein